ncbi:hypothetical protein VW35_06240 [Devosia soli]|uniref:Uncharacterized protein n=2 Tax=Devosia soli TaxID=361041 RepID=A0A0F5LCI5_9HYPH|nr:hypothetical protein VW35_06240 [Devosia soli]
MADYSLTDDELETLARFGSLDQPSKVDPQHFAKLISMALIEQKEGGPELTHAGRKHLARKEK